MRQGLLALLTAVLLVEGAAACSICNGLTMRPSLRQEALQAKFVYYGTLSNPRLNAVNAAGAANSSATDFTVDQVVKSDAARKSQKQFTIPRYVHVDPKAPPKYLMFAAEQKDGKLDFYLGTPVQSPGLVEYLRGATAIDPKDTAKILAFAGKNIDHKDADVAREAFLEFARSDDGAVLAAAHKLDPAKLRKLLDDPVTPEERLGLIAYLLGGCGSAQDAKRFQELLRSPDQRMRSALFGLYAGLVLLNPTEGWKAIHTTLGDAKRTFVDRDRALRALRFYHNANPTAHKAEVLAGLKKLLNQDDMADMAIEDLRHWRMWDFTTEIIGHYGQKGYDTPMTRRAILSYAVCCPLDVAKQLVARVRIENADLVKEVEESIQFEKLPAVVPNP